MSKILGIDLGTSNSAVSIIEGNNATIITNSEGKRTTPSIIAFTNDGVKVGDSAKRQAVVNPKNTISLVKRFIGKSYDAVKDEISRVSYEVVNNDGFPGIKIDDKIYTPQELSAKVLQKLKKTAEDYLGEEITRAVITVPAYFNDAERQATKEAGEIAGLTVERIINEPTAAALSYGLGDKDGKKIMEDEHKVLVFDFGGGTHDVSVLEIADGVFEVLSTAGDVHLGGDDVDRILIDYLAKIFEDDNGMDLKKDPMSLQRLKEAAENAKIELSNTNSTEINLPYITAIDNVPKHLVTTLTRAKFEQMIEPIVKRTIEPCAKALKDAKLKKEDIEKVILVGGSTRIPAIQRAVEEFFGQEAYKGVNPDEVVSLGAAVQGGIMNNELEGSGDILLLDVIPIAFGIETMGGVNTKLVEANTTIPTKKTEIFSTASDNQPTVDIHVLQGERAMAADNKSIGRFQLTDIPPAPRGVPQIEVSFDIDANGILNVSAKDLGTGKEQKITITGGSNLSEEEIKRMKEEAEANAEADKAKKDLIEKRNGAEQLVYSTEKQIKELQDKFEEGDKERLEECVKEVNEVKDGDNASAIDEKVQKLTDVWGEISQKIYQKQAEEQAQAENVETTEGGDVVEDVE